MEEFSHRVAIYASISEAVFRSLINTVMPIGSRTRLQEEQVIIAKEAALKAITASISASANAAFAQRDVVLSQIRLMPNLTSRARIAPFHGQNLMGPNPEEFDRTVLKLKDEHALHRGLMDSIFQKVGCLVPAGSGEQVFQAFQQTSEAVRSWEGGLFQGERVHLSSRPSASAEILVFQREGSSGDGGQAIFSRILQPAVPSAQENWRFAPDLSQLNHYLDIPNFKMETQVSVRSAIRQGEWAVSVDIRDAYLHVPMSRAVRRYLQFKVNRCVYQFTCLPLRLATSPREFTKLLRPVVALLQLKGVRLHVYLEDCLIRTLSPAQAQLHANLVIRVLQHLGWIINFDKSELQPSQTFDFIGMQFDTCTHTMVPLPKMRVKVSNTLNHWRSQPGTFTDSWGS